MRIAIIGAGAAGLAALRHCTTSTRDNVENDDSQSIVAVCYEQTEDIGGTWVYTPKIGLDKYGIPIHTSMYNNLRTNLPKEVMGFPDFPVPENPKSYLTRTEMLAFLNSYCDHFQLRQHIRFLHCVELIEPTKETKETKWIVKVKNLERNIEISEKFDAIMVCNGHYFQPNIPNIKGSWIFEGQQLHSHDYRVPEAFAKKTVVVIGAGPSGMDMALEISGQAKRVFLSHHFNMPINTIFPDNIMQKPDIAELMEHEVIFKDGSKESIDVVLYCTGYTYCFPFLSGNCGVKVISNMVTPLWKHVVSIENPTLAFVGIPFYVCAFSMFDLQVRFILSFWKGAKEFPSKQFMQAEERQEKEKRSSQGLVNRQFHMMGPEQNRYYQELADIVDITPLPPVLTALHNESSQRFLDNLVSYREDRYKIIDDHNFIQL